MQHDHSQHHEHHHEPAHGSPEELAICPVMNVSVNKKEAEDSGLVRIRDGHTYYFCCNTCVTMFDANPEQYTK
jgi:YHS domain-containing protein